MNVGPAGQRQRRAAGERASRVELVSATPIGDLQPDVRALIVRVIESMVSSQGRTLMDMASDLRRDHEARQRLAEMLGVTRAGLLSILYGAAGQAQHPHDLDADLMLDLVCSAALYRDMTGKNTDTALVEQLTDLLTGGQLPRVREPAAASSAEPPDHPLAARSSRSGLQRA